MHAVLISPAFKLLRVVVIYAKRFGSIQRTKLLFIHRIAIVRHYLHQRWLPAPDGFESDLRHYLAKGARQSRGQNPINEAGQLHLATAQPTPSGHEDIVIHITQQRPLPRCKCRFETAELTGMDAFEEVVNLEDVSALADPLKQRLADAVHQQAPDVTIR